MPAITGNRQPSVQARKRVDRSTSGAALIGASGARWAGQQISEGIRMLLFAATFTGLFRARPAAPPPPPRRPDLSSRRRLPCRYKAPETDSKDPRPGAGWGPAGR